MENKITYIGNRLIAEFMGYTFYHKGVDIDWSDIGGLYERKEVFSKVPILVNEYPEDDQYYFSEIPNPDFGNNNNPKWRNDREKLCWSTVNGGNYLTDLDYDSNWNSLMPVISKCYTLPPPNNNEGWSKINRIQHRIPEYDIFGDNITNVFRHIVKFIDWYNQEKTK